MKKNNIIKQAFLSFPDKNIKKQINKNVIAHF